PGRFTIFVRSVLQHDDSSSGQLNRTFVYMSNEAIHQGHVHSDIEKGIATIEFFHPRSNSLPGKILAKIAETITELGKHPDVRVIILRSAGEKAFCAGASFDELLSLQDFPQSKQFFMGFANVI